jgi:hypothetical protein
MTALLLAALVFLAAPPPDGSAQTPAAASPAPETKAPATVPAPARTAAEPPSRPLSFVTRRVPFHWDQVIPMDLEVDGLKVGSIFFNRRTVTTWPLKGAEFGTRAVVEVTNGASSARVAGVAVAVFDDADRLLGVASGGTGIFALDPGDTRSFDLSFHEVLERIPKGTYFHITVELRN